MPRIRTIKPEFFGHEGLFDLEKATGLPIRLAFAGLWTVADREGRFKWRPRSLKREILPYDDVDFAEVLQALADAKQVRRYVVDGEEYGDIPSLTEHQQINAREPQSKIPSFESASTGADQCTHMPEPVRALAEGKGKEGKGREGGGAPRPPSDHYAFEGQVIKLTKPDLERWRANFKHLANLEAQLTSYDAYLAGLESTDGWFRRTAGWLANKDEEARKRAVANGGSVPAPEDEAAEWRSRVAGHKDQPLIWDKMRVQWGPPPGELGCKAPAELLKEFGFEQARPPPRKQAGS